MLTVHFQVTVKSKHYRTQREIPASACIKHLRSLSSDTTRDQQPTTKMQLIKLCEYSVTEHCFILAKLLYFVILAVNLLLYLFLFIADIAPALLLLALTCDVWQVGQTMPVDYKINMADSCIDHARALLVNITDTLSENKLFSGISCMKQNMELNTGTDTPSVCAPQGSTCPGLTQPTPQFNQESCLMSIKKDLTYYYKFLAAHPDRPTVYHLREVMDSCFKVHLLDLEEDTTVRASTYDERLSLCKVLKGFQVRTITINRVIGYLASEEMK
ncbi:uncharacterized protein zmp:0000001127 isoform X1 [Mugil cephalus]|uniref:uncharacterized protein zmp:0000001127 isoform X1 n=1 Tax=Mugil cephalus TaxID=48193 RepID=UPI001FB6955A|nr:uncharacterized protein zmp:0000001127 isoform X1 [Mugil cephalus]